MLLEKDALIKAIIDSPEDDLPRLVFADWLDEHGDPDRAEFIRAEIELARRSMAENERTAMWDRRQALRRGQINALGHELAQLLIESLHRIAFCRGMIHHLTLWGKPVTRLPDGLIVTGDLALQDTPIRHLPKKLVIGGDLHLEGSRVPDLPNDLKINGNLFLAPGQLPERTVGELLDMPGLSTQAKRSALGSLGYMHLSNLIAEPSPPRGR